MSITTYKIMANTGSSLMEVERREVSTEVLDTVAALGIQLPVDSGGSALFALRHFADAIEELAQRRNLAEDTGDGANNMRALADLSSVAALLARHHGAILEIERG